MMNLSFETLPCSTITGKPVLHFANANGMPSKVYQPLFDTLEQYFTVEYIPLFGETKGYIVDNHWKNLTQQVIDNVHRVAKHHGVTQVVGLGHSLGALSTLQAAYKVPDVFSQIILCDPPLIYGYANFIWHLSKLVNILPFVDNYFVDKLSPAGLSKNRREVWKNLEEARSSFTGKSFFKDFDQRCFEGYLEHGLKRIDDGHITLSISKDNEVKVFRTNPSLYWLKPNRPPKCPVVQIVGKDSPFLAHKCPQKIQSRLKIPYVTHKGGHMFPLEHPESTAETILSLIKKQVS